MATTCSGFSEASIIPGTEKEEDYFLCPSALCISMLTSFVLIPGFLDQELSNYLFSIFFNYFSFWFYYLIVFCSQFVPFKNNFMFFNLFNSLNVLIVILINTFYLNFHLKFYTIFYRTSKEIFTFHVSSFLNLLHFYLFSTMFPTAFNFIL